MRNVAGFLPGGADKSTFGHTWRVVLAEHEGAAGALGWPTLAVDRGFEPGESVVTIARFTSGGTIGSIFGDDPERIAAYSRTDWSGTRAGSSSSPSASRRGPTARCSS